MRRLLRLAVLVVVAALAGYLVAHEVRGHATRDPDALLRTASAPTFSVHYPQGWRRVDPPSLTGLTLSDALSLGPGGDSRMQLGTARVATVGALPTRFVDSLSTAAGRPRAQTVALGAYRFDRYLDLRPRTGGGRVSVYLLATTRSTIVATCTTPTGSPAFTGLCESVLRTLRLAPGVGVSAQVDAAYALELNAILASLNQARQADGPGLQASGLDTRASAARRLAAAEDAAAQTAERLTAGSATTANDTLVSALHEAAGGYRALATAAAHDDRSAYDAAQRTLQRAQDRLTGAFRTLAQLGYALR